MQQITTDTVWMSPSKAENQHTASPPPAMAGDHGTEEVEVNTKQGGMRTIPFILANEVCDRFAAAGFSANMITYLTQQLHMPLVEASNTLTNFSGTSSLTPIIGAIVADSFAGRFWTITVGSIIYQLGMLSLTLSAIIPALRPPPCPAAEPQLCKKATPGQLMFLYASLICTAIGTGGIRPCVVAFGADQFGSGRGNAAGAKQGFFNLYFFSMGVALLLALTVVVYIQENVGWGWGLGIPTIIMAVSVIVFVAGYPLYIKLKPAGSPLTRLTQVVVAAFKKRKAAMPVDPSLLYEDKELDAAISTAGRLLHTEQITFLDRAAIIADGDVLPSGRPRPWRLSTVHRVEELKSIIRMLPIWAAGILLITAASHNGTFAIQQARSMDRHLTPSLQIPPASMAIFTVAAMLLSLAFYDRAFLPIARRITGLPSGITYFQRMGVGMSITVLSSLLSAVVETKRKSAAAAHGLLDDPAATIPISVFWLVPQYAVFGVAEAFMSVGHMEFLYDQAPESMRSSAAALFWLAGSIGSYTGTLLVSVVSTYSKRGGEEWLPNNINRGKLDYYYWLVTGLMLLNLVYYLVCARYYTFKPLETVAEEIPAKRMLDEEDGGGGGGGGNVELVGHGSSSVHNVVKCVEDRNPTV